MIYDIEVHFTVGMHRHLYSFNNQQKPTKYGFYLGEDFSFYLSTALIPLNDLMYF